MEINVDLPAMANFLGKLGITASSPVTKTAGRVYLPLPPPLHATIPAAMWEQVRVFLEPA